MQLRSLRYAGVSLPRPWKNFPSTKSQYTLSPESVMEHSFSKSKSNTCLLKRCTPSPKAKLVIALLGSQRPVDRTQVGAVHTSALQAPRIVAQNVPGARERHLELAELGTLRHFFDLLLLNLTTLSLRSHHSGGEQVTLCSIGLLQTDPKWKGSLACGPTGASSSSSSSAAALFAGGKSCQSPLGRTQQI